MAKADPDDLIDSTELWVEWMWLIAPRDMEMFDAKMKRGVKEIYDEIMKRADETEKRLAELEEMKKREIEEFKKFVRHKMG